MDDLTPLVGAAERALGTGLTAVERVPGGMHSVVLRARAGDRPVVVKAPQGSGEGGTRELAALRVLTAAGAAGVPALLAEGEDPPLLVLTDLGPGPSLADALLGDDPAAAQDALDGWAAGLGRFQAATAGLRSAYESELAAVSPLGPPPVDRSADQLAETAGALARHLPRLGVTPSAAALDALRALVPGGPVGMTPGDTCPDNAVRTPAGWALFDFEEAEFRPLAWEAAYLRVPFPSCWCAWTLPADAAERALACWRAELDLPAGFDAEVGRAAVAWTFVSTGWFLPRIPVRRGPGRGPPQPDPAGDGPAPAGHRPGHRPAGRPRRRDPRRPGPHLRRDPPPPGPRVQTAWAVRTRACSGTRTGSGRPTVARTRPGSSMPAASHGGGRSCTVTGSPPGYAAATR